MKKNTVLRGVIGFLFCVSALLIASCQGMSDLFSDSPSKRYNGPDSHGNVHQSSFTYQSGTQAYPEATGPKNNDMPVSSSNVPVDQGSTKTAVMPKKASGNGVPLDAPVVGQ